VCLLAAAVYLRRLVVLEFGHDPKLVTCSLLALFVFPTSFYFSIYYSESLFILLSLACLYHVRRLEWVYACMAASLLIVTKFAGVIIVVSIVYELVRAVWSGRARIRTFLSLLIIPAGMVAWMLYLYAKFGEPFAYAYGASNWNRKFSTVWTTLASIHKYPLFEQIMYAGSIALVVSAVAVMAARRFPFVFILHSVLLLLVYLSSTVLESIQRYVSMIVPIYLALGLVMRQNRYVEYGYLMFAVMLLTLFTVLYVSGYRMY
jgi:hypothetical protein